MSAGGLEVATAFLNAMPVDSGMGFVIVQHLDPTRESLLADLLIRETAMPVVLIEDGMRVEPNRVHIIIPAKTLLISAGILQLVEPEAPRGQRHPIDKFFSALAEDQKAKAIAIVLSGAGSNGTVGMADIKQAGGMVIAQDPATAKFDSMPRHAIASGSVDLILPPERMPEALLRYARHSYVNAPRPEMLEGPGADGSGPGIDGVLKVLHARAGHDFSQYKDNTLSRRIHRRMGLAHLEKLDDYLDLLEREPEEARQLFKDLLIHVTAFFRDADAWDALDREVIAPLVENAERGQAIRVWVPACSTGEEAYTIAMILAERGKAQKKELAVKIFATDAAEHHLATARKATFPGSMVDSLPRERINRFFDKIDDNYYRGPQRGGGGGGDAAVYLDALLDRPGRNRRPRRLPGIMRRAPYYRPIHRRLRWRGMGRLSATVGQNHQARTRCRAKWSSWMTIAGRKSRLTPVHRDLPPSEWPNF